MTTDLMPLGGSSGRAVGRREDRVLARQLDVLDRTQTYYLARIEAQAQLEAAKAHAVGFVGQQAMQAVTMVSQLEGQLGTVCPLAVTRLQGIADLTALSIAQVVSDTARRLS